MRNNQPAIVVDWSEWNVDRSWHLLRAAIAVGSRTLPILDMVFPAGQQGSSKAQTRCLQQQARVLPNGVQPIVVTDADFREAWFRAVESMSWQRLGRLRNTTYLRPIDVPDEPSQWLSCKGMYELPKQTPRRATTPSNIRNARSARYSGVQPWGNLRR